MFKRAADSPTTNAILPPPCTQLTADKSRSFFKILLFAAGPIFKDAPHVIRNFRDCHNVIRNAIYTSIVVICTGLFIYITAAFTDFKGLIGLIASATGGIDEHNIFLKALLYYLDYFMTTHISAAIADTILDASFIKCYGDREYALSNDRALELARAFNKPVEDIKAEFAKLRSQLRQGIAYPGIKAQEIEELVRAFVTQQADTVKARYDADMRDVNIILGHLELFDPTNARRQILNQFEGSLAADTERVSHLVNRMKAHVNELGLPLDLIKEQLIEQPVTYNPPSKSFPIVGTTQQQRNVLEMA